MVINLDWDGKWLRAKGRSQRESDILDKAPGRKAIFNSLDHFSYYRIPQSSLYWLVNQFGDDSFEGSAEPLLRELSENQTPLVELRRDKLTAYPHDERTLLKFQEEFVTLPKFKQRLLASLPTGTGKSLTSLMRAAQVGFNKLLIVGPRKLKVNWRSECRAALGKELLIYWGTLAQRKKLQTQIKDFDIYYVTFEQLAEFSHFSPPIDVVIIDEIHIVCNPATRSHKQLYDMVQHIPHRIGLSATPLRLRMKNLWGVLRLLDENLAGDCRTFVDEYEEILATIPIRKGAYTIQVPIKVRTRNGEHLRARLSSIMYRIAKADIVSFQDNVEIVEVEMSPRQQKLYTECRNQIKVELSGGSLDIPSALAKMTRLLQVAEGMFNLDTAYTESGKLEYLKDAIEEHLAAGDKVVVWSRFEPITRQIHNLFPKVSVVYSGKTSDTMRQLGIWAFNGLKDPVDNHTYALYKARYPDFTFRPGEAQVFVGTHSLSSGMGINLEAGHITYFTSFDWNPDVIFQARDRVSRLTQIYDTQTYFLVAENTLERKALREILQSHEANLRLLDGSGSKGVSLARRLVGLLYDI